MIDDIDYSNGEVIEMMILMNDMNEGERIHCVYESMCSFRKPRNKKIDEDYRIIATKWINLIPYQCLKRRSYVQGQLYQIGLWELRRDFLWNRYIENGKQKFWFDWLSNNFPLWQELNKGNNLKGEVTTVMLKFNELEILSGVSPSEVYDAWKRERNLSDQSEEIKIDLENLQRYIAQTSETIPLKTGNYKKQLQTNLAEAKIIEALAIGYDKYWEHPLSGKEYAFIPQTYKQEGNARRYYTGSIGLQRCHSMIRKVCLGHGIELDINTAVFAFYNTIVEAMGKKAPIITQYMSNKQKFREDIASVLTNTFKDKQVPRVKECITALGFGASDKQWGSLDKILRNEDDLKAFRNHPYVVELKEVIDFVHDTLKTEFADDIDKLRGKEGWMNGRSFNYKKFYAHCYQEWETQIMEDLMYFIQDTGGEIFLWVHDGVYIRGKLDAGYQHEIQAKYGEFVTFEKQVIDIVHYTNPANTNYKQPTQVNAPRVAPTVDYNQTAWDGGCEVPDTWGIH